MGKIRLGQIGIGHNHGEGKMRAARKFPDLFEIVGVCEPQAEWRKERGYWPSYQGLPFLTEDELLANCDAVLVETDVPHLTPTAARCLAAGKHIHMDKPAGGSYEQFAELLKTAERQNLQVQMGYMYRYNPAVRKCLDLIRNGELGEIMMINAEMSTFHPAPYKQWLSQFKGGIMYILGSHLVDLIVYLLGEPRGITSFLNHSSCDGLDFPDNNLAVLDYGKALAKITVSSVEVNGWGRRQLVVAGTRGTVEIKPLENRTRMTWSDLEIASTPYEDMKKEIPVEDVDKLCRYDTMMREFYDLINGRATTPFTRAHDLAVHKVLADVCQGYNFI